MVFLFQRQVYIFTTEHNINLRFLHVFEHKQWIRILLCTIQLLQEYIQKVLDYLPHIDMFSSELYAEFRYNVYMNVLTHSESYIEIHSYCIEI